MKPLRDWDELPEFMRTEAVRPYYDILIKHDKELVLKRVFDLVAAMTLLAVLAPIMAVLAVWIKLDSTGPVFFRQVRVTQYGKEFRIYKFRTMVDHADQMGSAVTVGDDDRVTKVGAIIRKYRLDEFPQLFNVIAGDMSFVGTRPEIPKYVAEYTDEMYATLLLPAGITCEASIQYKDENLKLKDAVDIDEAYITQLLPGKMKSNLDAIREFSIFKEMLLLIRTVLAVL